MAKVYGFGINDCPGWHTSKTSPNYNEYNERVYTLWKNMIMRCYNEKYQSIFPTYKGCQVSKDWQYLSKFAEDIKLLPGYRDWVNNPSKYFLDKDVLVEGNKFYSKSTCCFLHESESNREMVIRTKSKRVMSENMVTGEKKIYESAKDTEKDGFSSRNVTSVCRGEHRYHKGHYFRYLGGDDNEPIGKE